ADHEPLRPVRQIVQVDHGDLGTLRGLDRVRAAGRQVAADQPGQVPFAVDQAPGERVYRAHVDRAARPGGPGLVVGELVDDVIHQVAVGRQAAAVDADPA